MRVLLSEVGTFFVAVFTYWQAYLTGGITMAALFVYERGWEAMVPARVIVWTIIAFFVVACFMAWRDQYRAANSTKHTAAIKNRLAMYMIDAELHASAYMKDPKPDGTEQERFSAAVRAYLIQTLGMSYAGRFVSDLGYTLPNNPGYDKERWIGYHFFLSRAMKLKEILDALDRQSL